MEDNKKVEIGNDGPVSASELGQSPQAQSPQDRPGNPQENPGGQHGAQQGDPRAQYGNRQGDPRTQYGNRQGDPRTQYGNWQGDPRAQYGNWQGDPRAQYGNWQGDPRAQYGNWQRDPRAPYGNWQGDPRAQYGNRQGDPRAQYGNWQGDPQGQYQNRQGNPGESYPNYQAGYGQNGGPMKKQKKKKRKKWLFLIEIILLLILALGLFLFVKLGRMDRMSLKNILQNEGAASQSGYQNFVIYGVDSREGELTKDSHSDTIVICSINKKTKEIRMVSVYRDTYLDNTNGEYRKATECYYFGGPERSINMLNKNLDLDIRDYVAVNFNAVVKAVDLLGGIDIEVTEEEVRWLNGYQVENEAVTGAAIEPIAGAGYQHLNGNQTLAYCRIRYTDGYDFKRTERQRLVLEKIFEKAKTMGVPTLLSLVDTLLPSISTSFSNTELIGLVSGAAAYRLGENAGFPFQQTPSSINGDCVVPINLSNNVSQLHEFLFGEAGYAPSDTVQSISNEISALTGIY